MGDLKRSVRGGEHGLEFAARLEMNGETDACLEPAWRTTLFNQFRDILPGSCAAAAADQAKAEQGGVQSISRDGLRGAQGRLAVAPRVGEARRIPHLQYLAVRCHGPALDRMNALLSSQRGVSGRHGKRGPDPRDASQRPLPQPALWNPSTRCRRRKFKSYYFDNETLVERASPDAIHFRPVDESPAADAPRRRPCNRAGRMGKLLGAAADRPCGSWSWTIRQVPGDTA